MGEYTYKGYSNITAALARNKNGHSMNGRYDFAPHPHNKKSGWRINPSSRFFTYLRFYEAVMTVPVSPRKPAAAHSRDVISALPCG